jgi:Spy/CpxP family protein refolding chaperone
MSNKTRATAIAVIVMTLVAGIAIGIAADHYWLLHRGVLQHRGGSRFSTARVTERLDRELHFTPAQKTQVTQILDRHRVKIDALMSTVRPQVHQEVESSNREIDALLTPEQKTKFAQLRARSQRRRSAPQR